MLENPLAGLTEQLAKLPGIGPKSAQRLAFFLISLPKETVSTMARTMVDTRQAIRYCQTCFNISLNPVCHVCSDPKRDEQSLCIVADPKDIFALERTGTHKGLYHVLGGLISPIDGIHPETLRIEELLLRLREAPPKEIILAINSTIEGEATVLYLSALLKPYNLPISQLAYGLPVGGDLDYADEMTLQKAFMGRTRL
ncbi:MAG: recombination mediator RecR [Candidatus Margulisiibacteriota bacterium]